MGLFDTFKAKSEPAFTPQRAVMTIVVAAVVADGDVDEEEVGRLRSMCARSPLFQDNTRDEDDRLIDFALKVMRDLGDDAIPKASAALKQELRETALAFAVEVVLADGIVGRQEEAFIERLATTLGVGSEMAQAIVAVTTVRARGEH